jgi:hypothetical protein
MSATMTYSETLVVTHCWCGIAVAIPENLHRWMHKSDKNHCHCPVGHEFVFNNTLEEQLEEARQQRNEALQRVRATRDLLHAEERSHVATKGHLTRVKKRVHRGVCPHCNRSFEDLRRHMRSKHKDAIKAE